MATDAQLAANRRNALRSTGPTTAEGKEASRGNALRHGLRADTLVLLPSEDAGEFAAFAAGMQRSLAPADECEEALVRRIVLVSWRLERLCRIEADLLAGEANLVAHDAGIAEPPLGVWPEEMAGLARYEAMLDRALERAMRLLEKRQGARRRRGLAEEESTERTQLPEPAAAPARFCRTKPISGTPGRGRGGIAVAARHHPAPRGRAARTRAPHPGALPPATAVESCALTSTGAVRCCSRWGRGFPRARYARAPSAPT